MISIAGLTYSYPGTTEAALSELDLEIPAGQIVGLLGANGSGKSTLCCVLNGIIPQFYHGRFRGRVVVAGLDITSEPLSLLAAVVGLVFDDPFNQLSGARYTVREEVAFGLENIGLPHAQMADRIDQALAATGLSDLAERSPFALSGGQQQRLAIASIMAMRPRILVLDEPTSHLDPLGARQVLDALANLMDQNANTLIIVDQHVEWLAEKADRLLVLEAGRLVADGEPREVLAAAATGQRGIEVAAYTRAAQAARERGLIGELGLLPVTLQQALAYFR